MAMKSQTEAVFLQDATVTFNAELLVTSFTSVTFENLFLDEHLLNSVVNELAAQHIITKFHKGVCLKDPNKLLQFLGSKTEEQLEKFLVILLGGLGDEGIKENRKLMREEFAKTILTQISRKGTPERSQRIRIIGGHYSEFSETLKEILQSSETKLPDYIDYENLRADSGKEVWNPDLNPSELR